MRLTMIHTAEVHCESFIALRDRIAPSLELVQHVRADWLASAQNGISAGLETKITQEIKAEDGLVICTCTTIGPVAAKAGAIRIDQPMMQAAAQISGPILMVYCLQSTKEPSLSLLRQELEVAENPADVFLLPLFDLWELFEAGETQAFTESIASAIRAEAKNTPDLACVVLAQASMAGAAPLLVDLPFPVLSSPELAIRAALG